MSGVNVSLAGASSQSATTGSDGSYEFAGVSGGSYSVTLSSIPEGVTFPNVAKTTSINTDGQTATVDFSGSFIRTASISGTVSAGGGVSGATVTADGPDTKSATTDGEGNYSIDGLRAGDFTVEVSDLPEGVELSSTSKTVTLSAGQSATVNFSGTGQSTAKVSIERITWGNTNTPVPTSTMAGQVDFTVNVDEGNDNVTRVALTIDGEEVAFQSFSSAGAPAEGMNVAAVPEAVGGEFEIVFSENLAAFERDEDGALVVEEGHATPKYQDGDHDIGAVISTENGGESSAQSGTSGTFTNATTPNAPPTGFTVPVGNRVITSVSMPMQANDPGGLLWNGGGVEAEGIVGAYDGSTVDRMTITLDDDVNGGQASVTDMDGSDGFTASFPDDATFANGGVSDRQTGNTGGGVPGMNLDVTTVTSGGSAGPTTTNASRFRLDNVGPSVDNMHNLARSTRWINGAWTFGDVINATGGVLIVDNPMLASSTGTTGRVGVGYDRVEFMAGPSQSDTEMVESGADLDETFDNDADVLGLTAYDRLDNASTFYYAGLDTDGVDDEDDAEELGYTTAAAVTADGNARIGVDKVKPTKDLAANSLEDMDAMTAATANTDDRLIVTFADTRSGFTPTPVMLRSERAHPGVTAPMDCAFGSDADPATAGFQGCDFAAMAGTFDYMPSNGAAGPGYTNGGETDAYYTNTFFVGDEAGNETDEMANTVLLDTQNPSLGGFTIPATLNAGDTEMISAAYSENIDADEAFFFLEYGDAVEDFFLHLETENLGEWGPDEFTTSGGLDVSTEFTSHIENNGFSDGADVGAGAADISADNARFRIFDFAGNLDQRTEALTTVNGSAADFSNVDGMATTDDNVTSVMAWMGDVTAPGDASDDNLCADFGGDGCPTNPTTRDVHLQVAGAGSTGGGALQNLFQRVIFVAPMSGPDGGGGTTADPIGWQQVGTGTVSITDDGTTRTYTYSGTVDVADLEVGVAPPTPMTVWAVAFTPDGANALMAAFDFGLTED